MATADHSHTMTINGYAEWDRGKRGVIPKFVNATEYGEVDGIPYMVFSYANGPGFYRHLRVENDNVTRVNPDDLELVCFLIVARKLACS